MSKLELTLFLEFAPQYLNYVTRCHEEKQPTLLGKIVGVYTVTCRTSSGTGLKSNLLVCKTFDYENIAFLGISKLLSSVPGQKHR